MISHIARLHLTLVALVGFVLAIVFGFLFLPSYELKAEMPLYCTKAPSEVDLVATAAYAEDLVSGEVLYAKNANAQLPLASLTKIMTVVTAIPYLPEGVVKVPLEALEPEGDSGLRVNETWSIKDLTDFTLMSSLNDGARTLALAAAAANGKDLDWFISEMNKNANQLGLSQTFFLNDTGLDISSTTAGAYGSAKDIARLFAYFAIKDSQEAEGSVVQSRTFISLDQTTHNAKNTSGASVLIDRVMLSKTGFTDLAGGNLGVVYEPLLGRPVAVVVLGSTREKRDEDIALLAEAAKKELKRKLLCEKFYENYGN